MNDSAVEAKRGVGRPSRISREQIIGQTLQMLEADGLDAFSMVKLAKALSSSPMAIYTYFGSRDDLLDACADAIFRQFEPPAAGAPWRASIAAWLDALRILFERWPIALKLIKWEEHISPAWFHVWLPMTRALHQTGLRGDRLAFASAYVGKSGMGLIVGHLQAPTPDKVRAWLGEADVVTEDRELLEEVFEARPPERRQALYAFGVDAILAALDRLVSADASP